jgi:hypothetical protein
MDIFQGISLSPLPSFTNGSSFSNGGGACYKNQEDENVEPGFFPRLHSRSPIIVRQDSNERELTFDDDSSDDEGFESFEDYDSYKQRKILKMGRKIQRMISKNYLHDRNVTMEWQTKLRSLIVDFVKMYLHDYHADMYHHITSILLDCKGMTKQFGYTEEKEFILRGLKMIQEKSLSEGIPAGGGGGPDYWTSE